MTREDVQDLLAMIQGTYSNFNPQDKRATVNAWLMALEDFDRNQIAMAFKSYVRTETSGFAPTPGKLIERIASIKHLNDETETEAWMRVAIALRNGAYGSEQEFAKFPPMVQKAVGSAKQLRIWAMDEHFNEEVAKAQFLRVYRTESQRAMDYEKLPGDVQRLIDNARGMNMITAGGES